MTPLRWMLGIITLLLLAAWILLTVVGGNFRRSFGASPTSPLLAVAPIVTLACILASLIWPDQRGLLHVTAVLAGMATLVCLWVLRESPTTGILGLGFLASWFAFYGLTLRATALHG